MSEGRSDHKALIVEWLIILLAISLITLSVGSILGVIPYPEG
jgi:hypothetical protein